MKKAFFWFEAAFWMLMAAGLMVVCYSALILAVIETGTAK